MCFESALSATPMLQNWHSLSWRLRCRHSFLSSIYLPLCTVTSFRCLTYSGALENALIGTVFSKRAQQDSCV